MTKRCLLVLAAVCGGCNSTTKSEKPALSDGAADVKTGSGGSASGGSGGAGSGGATGSVNGTGGGFGSGGSTGTGGSKTDGAVDARRDGGPGGDGGVVSTGGSATGGAGGIAIDARFDLRPDMLPDTKPDAGTDGGSDTSVTKSEAGSDGNSTCPYTGHVTYIINQSANASTTEQEILKLAKSAMDKAISYYNCYTNITKAVQVSYNSGTTTADGNINGSIRFGSDKSYVEYTRAMHEISHTVGIGTASNWRSMISTSSGSGTFTGTNATAEVRAIKGDTTSVITADNAHFWPYGLNYASEVKDESELLNHCRMVVAIRKDLGMN
jgi:hypothetical protein